MTTVKLSGSTTGIQVRYMPAQCTGKITPSSCADSTYDHLDGVAIIEVPPMANACPVQHWKWLALGRNSESKFNVDIRYLLHRFVGVYKDMAGRKITE